VQRDPDYWRDVANWPTVLPNLGRSVSLAALEDGYREAKEKGPAEERLWASQHLNIQIGVGMHFDRWPGADHWEDASEPGLTLASLIARCEVCTIGIDGGGLDDLLGITVMGREAATGAWLSVSKAICARVALGRRKDIAAALADFERQGDLIIVDSLGEDLAHVAAIVLEVFNAGLLPEKSGIGLDMHGISALVDALVEAGVPHEMFAGIAQGYRLNGVIQGAARRLADGSYKPALQPLMNWCVGNARTEQRGNAVLITKQVSGSSKIDPLLALFSAFELMSRHPQASNGPSVYDERGVLTV
jgi:phage terminase large subunit-like protein